MSTKNHEILWIIAARSGSKSIPNKNIKKLGDLPLLAHRIKSALSISPREAVWISTDSREYAKIAEEYGAKVPFLRPKVLAQDDSSSVDVVLHAMHHSMKNGYVFQYIGLLEPTSPFVTAMQLKEGLNTLAKDDCAHSIVSVRESRPNTIFIQREDNYLRQLHKNLKGRSKINRQEFKKEVTPSGGFYISKWDKFLENKTFYPEYNLAFFMDNLSGIEIDEPIDWHFAEFLLKNVIGK